MPKYPKSREEARKMRYGACRGYPNGLPYNDSICVYPVLYRGVFHQCYHKPGHGPDDLYCRQHEKMLGVK